MTPDKEPTDKPRDSKDEKTVKLQRCPKHGTLHMPNEECPECEKERKASA